MGNSKSSLTRSEYNYIIHARTDSHEQILWKYKPDTCPSPRCHEIDWFLGPQLLYKSRTYLQPPLSLSRWILESVFNPTFERRQPRDNKQAGKGAKSFHRFNDLPMELRIKIIKLAAEPCHVLPTGEFWFFMLCLRDRHLHPPIRNGCCAPSLHQCLPVCLPPALTPLSHLGALLVIARRWGFNDRLALMGTSWLCREVAVEEWEKWVEGIEYNGVMGDSLKRVLMGELRMVRVGGVRKDAWSVLMV